MENFGVVFVIGIIVLATYVVLRPIVGTLFFKKQDEARPMPRWLSGAQQTALEVAALVSLMIAFPYGMFGYSSITILISFAVGLAIIPAVARPAIAVVLLTFAVTELDPAANFNLFLVIVSFLVLRAVFRLFGRMFGSG